MCTSASTSDTNNTEKLFKLDTLPAVALTPQTWRRYLLITTPVEAPHPVSVSMEIDGATMMAEIVERRFANQEDLVAYGLVDDESVLHVVQIRVIDGYRPAAVGFGFTDREMAVAMLASINRELLPVKHQMARELQTGLRAATAWAGRNRAMVGGVLLGAAAILVLLGAMKLVNGFGGAAPSHRAAAEAIYAPPPAVAYEPALPMVGPQEPHEQSTYGHPGYSAMPLPNATAQSPLPAFPGIAVPGGASASPANAWSNFGLGAAARATSD